MTWSLVAYVNYGSCWKAHEVTWKKKRIGRNGTFRVDLKKKSSAIFWPELYPVEETVLLFVRCLFFFESWLTCQEQRGKRILSVSSSKKQIIYHLSLHLFETLSGCKFWNCWIPSRTCSFLVWVICDTVVLTSCRSCNHNNYCLVVTRALTPGLCCLWCKKSWGDDERRLSWDVVMPGYLYPGMVGPGTVGCGQCEWRGL